MAPLPAERAMGARQRRHKGSARAYERRKVFAKQNPEGGQAKSLAELSERPLRGRLPVLRCCPLCALLSLDSESEEPDHRDAKSLHRLGILDGG